ncbi:MAG: response regulator [Deltaproteobacteria bacterium]|nr:MAG: hypothetical protein DME71_09210 [Verrucomicrobiota bacterium]TMB61739.1 MAG: response regulator [Deltaproteobacteria bacterium]
MTSSQPGWFHPLIEAGHDPIFVHNGERALDKAKETPFDLVVLDIILPGMDGFNVLRHLRSQHTKAAQTVAHRQLDRRRDDICGGGLRKGVAG